MTPHSDPTSTPSGTPTDSAPKKKVNPLLKFLMLIIAVPAMLIRKSQKALDNAVYSGFAGGFRSLIGGVLGLATGIGTSYAMGWLGGFTLKAWLPAGILALAITYVYIWPLLYLGIFKTLARGSEALWKAVGREDNKSWVSYVLMGIGYIAIVLAAMYLGWDVLGHVKGKLIEGWGWPSWISWPIGVVAGGIVGLIGGAIAWWALTAFEMAIVAAASGALLTWTFHSRIDNLIAPYAERFGLPADIAWGGYAVVFAIYVAYLFPLVHVILTHALGRFVKWLSKLPEAVYGSAETASNYRQFFAQIVNIAGAVQLARVALKGAAYLELSAWYAYPLAAVVALLTYVLLGEWLKRSSNRLVSVITLAHIPFLFTLPYIHANLWFGIWGAILASAVVAAITHWLVFPLFYVIVRFLTNRLIASWAAKYLVAAHEKVSNGLEKVVREIGHAFSNTYDDESPYSAMFLQVVNLAAVAGVGYGMVKLGNGVGFANWLTFGLTGLAAIVSYALLGKLFAKAGTPLVGVLLALASGVFTGTIGYAFLPHGSAWWIVAAVGIGIVGALLMAFAIFPLLYVLLKLVGDLATSTVGPILVGAHTWVWKRCEDLWNQFVETYRSVEAWFKPIWENISKTWDDTWQSVKEFWDSNTGKK